VIQANRVTAQEHDCCAPSVPCFAFDRGEPHDTPDMMKCSGVTKLGQAFVANRIKCFSTLICTKAA